MFFKAFFVVLVIFITGATGCGVKGDPTPYVDSFPDEVKAMPSPSPVPNKIIEKKK